MLDVVLERHAPASRRSGRAAARCGTRGRGGRRRGCRARTPSRTRGHRRRASADRAGPGRRRPARGRARPRADRRRAARRAPPPVWGGGWARRTTTSTAAPTATPPPTASTSSGTPALPGDGHHDREHQQASGRRRAARTATSQGLPTGDDRGGAGHEGERREAASTPPRCRRSPHRRTAPAMSKQRVEQREQPGTGTGREHDDTEAAPPLPDDEGDDHQRSGTRGRRSA